MTPEWLETLFPSKAERTLPWPKLNSETVMLWRPVGEQELHLIAQYGYRAFPPRLPDQPIFYPVLNQPYAEEIARDWNATRNTPPVGFVTEFDVLADVATKYKIQIVGAQNTHQELWVPAEELSAFNAAIVGPIRVVEHFTGEGYQGEIDPVTHLPRSQEYPMSQILFYDLNSPYGEFSNFSRHPIEIGGLSWPTSEHYFQAQKFAGTPHAEEVRALAKPMLAAQMGRRRDLPLRPDWEAVKDAVMMAALRAKFIQHPELRELLLGTGDAKLVEHTANDSYWADGGDGNGRNRLGELLMDLRAELQERDLP